MYKVLLVDDEPIIVEGLARSVEWGKFNCEVVGLAYDGMEGKELIRKLSPDLVFIDICMPEMNGLNMIAAIKSEFPNLQVTVLTGFRDFEYAQTAIRLGVCRFLLKPSNMQEIEEAVGVMCANLMARGIDGKDDETEEENDSSNFIVKNALEYMEANFAEKLTLSEVAEKTYVSQWHLSKLLNRHVGQSFFDILNQIRIKNAKELLKNPAMRVGDIAEEVGFSELPHFSRVFKKLTGMTANEYRNKYCI